MTAAAAAPNVTDPLPVGGNTPRPKLTWCQITPMLYTADIAGGVITVQVNQSHSPQSKGKWGVVIGLKYWSKDKGQWWDSAEMAMVKAEALLLQVANRIKGKLEG